MNCNSPMWPGPRGDRSGDELPIGLVGGILFRLTLLVALCVALGWFFINANTLALAAFAGGFATAKVFK